MQAEASTSIAISFGEVRIERTDDSGAELLTILNYAAGRSTSARLQGGAKFVDMRATIEHFHMLMSRSHDGGSSSSGGERVLVYDSASDAS